MRTKENTKWGDTVPDAADITLRNQVARLCHETGADPFTDISIRDGKPSLNRVPAEA